jgi:flagellar biosynthesis/type III secretory pathway M-ring protein FliF/YscJ
MVCPLLTFRKPLFQIHDIPNNMPATKIMLFELCLIAFVSLGYFVGHDNYIEIATTDDIKMANKVQKVLLDNYFSTKLSKDGTKYEIFALCRENEIDNIMVALSESDAINQDVGLELFDKGDFTTTKESKREKLINTINNRLTTIINKFQNVENVSVLVSIPEQAFYTYNYQPITANINIETGTVDLNKHRRMEKSIRNLLISTITGLTEENLKIIVKVVK